MHRRCFVHTMAGILPYIFSVVFYRVYQEVISFTTNTQKLKTVLLRLIWNVLLLQLWFADVNIGLNKLLLEKVSDKLYC